MKELLDLREQILADIMPLVLESTVSGQEQFNLLFRIIQTGNANKEIYQRAYEVAKGIEGRDDRMYALMDLLSEIDFSMQASVATDGEAPAQPDSVAVGEGSVHQQPAEAS